MMEEAERDILTVPLKKKYIKVKVHRSLLSDSIPSMFIFSFSAREILHNILVALELLVPEFAQ